MKAALREQQQKEIEQYNQEVAQTIHTNEPTIVDELIRIKQLQKNQNNKKKPKLFVKVVPVQPSKRKTLEDNGRKTSEDNDKDLKKRRVEQKDQKSNSGEEETNTDTTAFSLVDY